MSEWKNFVRHYIDIKAGETSCKCGKHTALKEERDTL